MTTNQPADPAPKGGRVRRRWKQLAVGAVVLFVVFSVGRSILPALNIQLPGKSKPAVQPSTQVESPPPATVNLNGTSILGGGQPIITLNPGLVRPGSTVAVIGSGFDPGSRVDVLVSDGTSAKPQQMKTVTASKDGAIGVSLPFPTSLGAGSTVREVTAQQRNSDKVAKADAMLAQGTAAASLYPTAARPGDTVSVSAQGFASGEDVGLYWGRVSGQPTVTLQADSSGSIGKVAVKVGAAPVGIGSLFLVGKKSGAAASAPFQVLGLYPTIKVSPYAVKAAQRISFSGKGFVPGERVLVHVNSAGGAPVAALPSDQYGGFGNAGFVVPFGLTGRQSVVFIGEQSRATATAGFQVLPYMPAVRASTYGALPGTSLTFYATGFAPNEAVHVFVGRGSGGGGDLVAAFRVDGSGSVKAGGTYLIPGDAGKQVTFTLLGAKSNASGTATVKVDSSGGGVDVPPQPKYVLPKDLER